MRLRFYIHCLYEWEMYQIISKQLKDKITGINPEFLDQKRNGHGIAFIAIFIFDTIRVRDENKPNK